MKRFMSVVILFLAMLGTTGSVQAKPDVYISILISVVGMPDYCDQVRIDTLDYSLRWSVLGWQDGTLNTTWCGIAGTDTPAEQINGTMRWWVKPGKVLARCGTIDLHTESDIWSHDMRSGDANDDNTVNIQDWTLVHAAFGYSCATGGHYDRYADFNNDCIVDIRDFGILRVDFGLSGCPRI